MQRIKTVKAKDNLKKLISRVNKTKKAITLINSKGEKAILISEREWNNIKETLYLTSIPGLVEDIKNILETEDCDSDTTMENFGD